MITIICGEDSVSSRKHYNDLREIYQKKGYEAQFINPKEIQEQITNSQQIISLFSQKIIFITENLNSFLSRAGRVIPEYFVNLSQSKNIEIIDWEEGKPSRELKITKLGTVKEFKPQRNIFQLLDACYPSNKVTFLMLLDAVSSISDEIFIFTMLTRHTRNLILVKNETYPVTLAPWQRGKLRGQTAQWTSEKLIGFYEGLGRIDRGVKTNSNPYGIKRSLDILACYYL